VGAPSGGFYDTDLEWVRTEGLQLVATLVPSSATAAAGGGTVLSARLAAAVRVCAVPYPSVVALQTIYRAMLQPIVATSVPPCVAVASV